MRVRTDAGLRTFTMIDANGIQRLKKDFLYPKDVTIDVMGLKQGVYIIKAELGNTEVITKKIYKP